MHAHTSFRPPRRGRHWRIWLLVLASMAPVTAALVPSQVLVLYNSSNADSLAIWQHYAAARPGVRGLNLANATLQPGTVTYADYVSKIRQPLRTYLTANSLQQSVVVFVLTKGLPHRIQDINAGDLGDNPGAASTCITGGNASYCSVDSELTLLWQNLETGEKNGNMDSGADNYVMNPYFSIYTPITNYSRTKITQAKYFSKVTGPSWKLLEQAGGVLSTPGDIYLTARLDGNTRAAVIAMIDRGKAPCYNKQTDCIIEDKSANSTLDLNDYKNTYTALSSQWTAFNYEQTDTFLIGLNGNLDAGNTGTQRFSGRVAVLSGYGVNHSGTSKTGYIRTFQGQLVAGAIFNTFESFNGRKFGGVSDWGGHGQLSDWVDAGGTFGTGHAWEPLSSSVARNVAVLNNYFLQKQTWVESAWSGMRYLSWQNLVLGDPLAVASFGTSVVVPMAAAVIPVVTLSTQGGVREGTTRMATLTLTLDQAAPAEIRAGLTFTGGTNSDDDFSVTGLVDGAVVIPAGATQAEIQLQAVTDTLPEGDEWLHVALVAGENYQAGTEVSVIKIEDLPYDGWRHQAFASAPDAPATEPTGDPDHDGLSNLLEYAMGLDPAKSGDPGAPSFAMQGSAGQKEAVFRFQRNLGATGASSCAEWSADLKTWHPATATTVATAGQIETLEVRLPNDGLENRFFRVAVTAVATQ